MVDSKYFLREGELTGFTDLIKSVGDKINGQDIDLILNISEEVNAILDQKKLVTPNDGDLIDQEYQRRSSDEILQSDHFFGCSDVGLLFVTLARYKGISAKFIHCVDVISTKDGYVSGHVYVECYINDNRYLIDPNKGLLKKLYTDDDKRRLYKIGSYQLMVEVYSGLDNFDAGIKTHKEMLRALKNTAEEYHKSHSK